LATDELSGAALLAEPLNSNRGRARQKIFQWIRTKLTRSFNILIGLIKFNFFSRASISRQNGPSVNCTTAQAAISQRAPHFRQMRRFDF
jgi:hypothetical protein